MSSNTNSQGSSSKNQQHSSDYWLRGVGAWCYDSSEKKIPRNDTSNCSAPLEQTDSVPEPVSQRGDQSTMPVSERSEAGKSSLQGKRKGHNLQEAIEF